MLLYFTIPQFDYSDIVYDTATETNKVKLQILQTRIARLIIFLVLRIATVLFGPLRWLSLQHPRNLHKRTMVYTC